ncbi:MAG: hypothetical protein CMG39_01045 [Candidatus Marinimicrobia bacterium]|nr:hypothetical protein [Candidatus Neomarinimicrobiota bacterium]|tara:strand:+ start:1956 stop:2891 length:936 start_codon:yes stop_codon:yes gene_type:complete
MSKILILIFILLISACNKLPNSTGKYNEITVVSSFEDRDYAKLFVGGIFNDSIYTPILQNSYIINYINPKNFADNKLNKNLIIFSLDFPQDSTIDLLSNKFIEKYENNIISFNNMFSKNQLVLHLRSFDYDNLVRENSINFEWIKTQFDVNISENILYDYNKEEKSEEINQKIKNKFSININIDDSYKVIKEDDSFLWIGRGFPYRWLVINKLKSSNNKDIELLKIIFEKKLTSVKIPNLYLKEKKYQSFKKVRGIYEHLDSDTGGPFVSYIYEDKYKNYKLCISGFVNNPGKDKILLLKQLESIIENIKE